MRFDPLTVVCCAAVSDLPESIIEKILAVAERLSWGNRFTCNRPAAKSRWRLSSTATVWFIGRPRGTERLSKCRSATRIASAPIGSGSAKSRPRYVMLRGKRYARP